MKRFTRKSQKPGFGVPVESGAVLNRFDLEAGIEIRPPVLERTFTSGWLVEKLQRDIRHTIEPLVQYNFVGGIDNFHQVLRFDETDVASDTNEFYYALTQHLYTRNLKSKPCTPESELSVPAGETLAQVIESGAPLQRTLGQNCESNSREWITWTIAQKYFIDPRFGGAISPGQRNVLVTTLNLTGVAFLVFPRDISPVISRLRMSSTEHTDIEWDLDYDTTRRSNSIQQRVRRLSRRQFSYGSWGRHDWMLLSSNRLQPLRPFPMQRSRTITRCASSPGTATWLGRD